MKKNYLLVILMCISSFWSLSQTITLAPDTAVSGNTTASPLNAYYSDMRFQAVYTKAEINAQSITGANTITAMAFYVDIVPAGGVPTFTISLGNTSATNSSSHDAAATTTVYTASPASLVVGWNTFTFSTPFIWNGNDNLLVNTCASSMPYTSPYGGIRTYNATSGSRYARADGSSRCGTSTNSTLGTKPHAQFTFVAPPSCLPPAGVSFANVTGASADASWTHAGALVYGIEYGVSGFTLGAGTQDTSAALTKTLSGLTANTTYDFYIKALCSLTDSSTVAGPFSFTTPCDAVSVFPYTENFDGALTNNVWNCWSVINNDGGVTWSQSATYISPRSGSSTAHGMGNGDDYLISPQFTIGASPIRVRFWDIVESATRNNTYTVRVSTTGTAIADFTDSITTIDCSNTSWLEHIVDLSAYTNQNIYVAFHQTFSSSSFWGFGIDDFRAEAVPNCPEASLTSLSANSVTGTSADISWTEAGTATSWRIEYGAPGFMLGSGTGSVESNDTVSLSGLLPFTTYDFYVTSLCTPTDSSVWTGPFSFTTLCNDTNAGPWMDNVEGHPSTNVITGISNCWSGTKTGTSFEWEITNSGTTGSSGTGALSANSGSNYFYTEASGAGTSDTTTLISPSINLSSLTLPTLDFYYHMFGNQMGTLNVEIFDGTTWTNEVTISGSQQATQASDWNQQYVDLTSYSGIIQIRFVAISNGSFEGDICIDDVSVNEAPTCTQPVMVTTAGTLNDTTTVSWMAPSFGTPVQYYVEYGPAGFAQGAGTIDSTTSMIYGIGGLTGSTSYDFYVVTYCGATDSSIWVGPISFTTLCDPYTPTHAEDFSSYLPTCWEEANGVLTTNSNVIIGSSDWGADGFANVGFTGAARMNIYSTNRNDWLISAPIDLGDGSIPYQVEYDVALTDYSSTGPDAMGVDDTLALVISTDFGQTWSSANILRNYVSGDEPSNAGNR
ncbi:MAG: choice-of-anchor J domain-containing protein, partial [Flavobacteriales bacterium]